MQTKIVTAKEALSHIKSGSTLMMGGFFYSGAPVYLARELTMSGRVLEGITLISNDAISDLEFPDAEGNALVATGMFSKIICSYIGHNHEAVRLSEEGLLELELLPMGTFAERIRIGGSGIGGFLTATGLGTEAADHKQIVELDGKQYLLEKPLRADVAIIYGSIVDEYGNVCHRGIARNFNIAMATAADYVIVEAKEIVKGGSLNPDLITIPAPYIDAIVLQKEENYE